jgi:GNAT superfamily N-acetyltransferase
VSPRPPAARRRVPAVDSAVDPAVEPGVDRTVDPGVTFELVPAPVVRPLRQEVLRPGDPPDDVVYPGDDDARTAHGAARRRGGEVMAVGSVLPEPPPWDSDRSDGWRVRGMATRAGGRGRGVGRGVLDLLMDHVAAHGGGLVWCNARTGATTFYERAGFSVRGAVFELPRIGPHRTMWRLVEAGAVDPGPAGGMGHDA